MLLLNRETEELQQMAQKTPRKRTSTVFFPPFLICFERRLIHFNTTTPKEWGREVKTWSLRLRLPILNKSHTWLKKKRMNGGIELTVSCWKWYKTLKLRNTEKDTAPVHGRRRLNQSALTLLCHWLKPSRSSCHWLRCDRGFVGCGTKIYLPSL